MDKPEKKKRVSLRQKLKKGVDKLHKARDEHEQRQMKRNIQKSGVYRAGVDVEKQKAKLKKAKAKSQKSLFGAIKKHRRAGKGGWV